MSAARVVIDLRPLQEPERTPTTAEYLAALLAAFAAQPVTGESFVPLLRALRADPTLGLAEAGLPISARRWLPPTSRVLRAAGLTLDSFLLRGAELRAGRGTAEAGAAVTVFHTAGGAVPLASRLPVVATLLDLAPWELPQAYAASPAARFGHRLRRRVLHDAARVIVASRSVAESAQRRLHLHEERISIVPLAASDEFRAAGRDPAQQAALRQRLELPERYMAFVGRYDARMDMATLFRALTRLRGNESPPTILLAARFDIEEDLVGLQRAAAGSGAGEQVRVLPRLSAVEQAALVGGAEALLQPALSDATGLAAVEALSLGVPVICARSGALPDVVGSAGIVVEPREPARLAAAIEALWSGGAVARQVRRAAQRRTTHDTRTWADVARETRAVYAQVARPGASR
jgi:glycosyltransferase involved in cell wall biosynthesis